MYIEQEEEQNFEWRKYLDMALRHLWLVFIPPIFTGLIAGFFAFSMPKVYQASSLILLEGTQLINPLISGLAVSTSGKDKINAVKEEILSWPRLMQLIEELHLVDNQTKKMEMIKKLKRNIKVILRKNGLIIISCENEIPLNAQNIVKKISEILIKRDKPLSLGYFDVSTELESETFLPSGYLSTGDIASIDDEGYITLIGRSKNSIVTKEGKKFHPELLEEKIIVNVDDNLEFYNNYYDNIDFQDHLIRALDKLVSGKLKEKI